MKIETPQILWHSNADADQGRAAPLYAVSMLPVEAAAAASTSTSRNVLATVGNTPEIHLWEVGFSRSGGKPAAATAAPKNSILQQSTTTAIKHIQTLGRRTIDRSLNAVAFSPCGRHLAAAGDGGVVVVYTLPPARIPILDAGEAPGKNGRVWCDTIGNGGPTGTATTGGGGGGNGNGTAPGGGGGSAKARAASSAPSDGSDGGDGERLLRTKVLPAPSPGDVMDLSWSADSKRLTAGCLDHAVVTYENVQHGGGSAGGGANGGSNGSSSHLTGRGYAVDDAVEPKWAVVHRSTTDHVAGYVQGVAADPRGIYLASQGSDRTVRVWGRKGRRGAEKVVAQQLAAQLEKEGGGGGGGEEQKDKDKEKDGEDKGKKEEVVVSTAAGTATATTTATTTDVSSATTEEPAAAPKEGPSEANASTTATASTTAAAQDPTAAADAPMEITEQQPTVQPTVQPPVQPAQPEQPKLSAEEQLLLRARTNVATARAFTSGKFELGKARIIKFRDNSVLEEKGKEKEKEKDADQDAAAATTASTDGGEANVTTSAGATAGAPPAEQQQQEKEKEKSTNIRRQHLFGDESTIESFFRRLSWTADGAYLICPSALWHGDNAKAPSSSFAVAAAGENANDAAEQQRQEGPSYATCLFARHHFDQPCRVLAGLEKPSVVVRPNPVLFRLPPGAAVPEAGDGDDEEDTEEEKGPASTSITARLPYRSIFAVLTLDSVLIYDTYHANPLCLARGLHYANLTDAVWSPDGLTLMVSSRDGYISILNFADGELGEKYVPALEAAEAKIVQEEAAKLASRPMVPVPRAVNTAATPSAGASRVVSVTPNSGDVATLKIGKKRVVPTLLPVGDSNAMVTDATDKVEESTVGSATADVTTAAAEATAAEPNILQPKKKKKRVQPVLVTCD